MPATSLSIVEAVLIPEIDTSPEELVQQLRRSRERGKKHAIVVVAEGAKYDADALVRYFEAHGASIGTRLRMTRLGHIQRGGAPNAFDRLLASRFGAKAIELIGHGKHDCLVGIRQGEIVHTPLSEVTAHPKRLDLSTIALADQLSS